MLKILITKIIITLFLFCFISGNLYSQTWKELNSKGIEYCNEGNYSQAIIYFQRAIIQAEIESGKNNSNYTSSLHNLAVTYQYSRKYKEAEEVWTNEINRLQKQNFNVNDPYYVFILNDLALLYQDIGDYNKAESLLLKVYNFRKTELSETDSDFLESIKNLAGLYMEIGTFTQAESYYKELIQITNGFTGESRVEYASALNSLALVYNRMGNYSESEILNIEALSVRKDLLGKNHPDYASSLNNLALLYINMQKYNEAVPLLNEAITIAQNNFDSNTVEYAVYLDNLASAYNYLSDFSNAESHYIKALNLRKELLGTSHQDYASSLNNLTALYARMGNYLKAESLCIESLKLLDFRHPNYNTTLMNLAAIYMEEGNNSDAFNVFKEINSNYLQQLNSNFVFLSESEKVKYLKSLYFNFEVFFSFALNHYDVNSQIASDLLSLRMATKGIVLASNIKMRSIIKNTGNPELEYLYGKYCGLRNDIITATAISPENQMSRGINLMKMEREANDIEKELSLKSDSYGKYYNERNVSIADIQNALSQNEAAIEFIDFRYWKTRWTDTVYYSALINIKGTKNPFLVTLCRYDELREQLLTEAGSEKSYLRNPDLSTKLYKLIWEPIEPYLKDINKVYLSPAGLLNKVSFAALNIDDKNLLIDKYKIRYVTNLNEIIEIKNNAYKTLNDNKSAALFGGLIYDIDENTVKEKVSKYKVIGSYDSGNISVYPLVKSNPGNWKYLKGTLMEIDKIKPIISGSGIKVYEFKGADGVEEAFNSFSGRTAPSILHVATHGFFNSDKDEEIIYSGKEFSDLYSLNSNPLINTGLVFSGANKLNQINISPGGIEDGILTAYEVVNLDFSNTNLIVLSACETGLGEIKGSEGVYGLQRAFKIAGVKNIIMSLWKVPDDATVDLMESFYKNWLIKKLTLEDAFSNAQAEIRNKYADPFMWAAFILQ